MLLTGEMDLVGAISSRPSLSVGAWKCPANRALLDVHFLRVEREISDRMSSIMRRRSGVTTVVGVNGKAPLRKLNLLHAAASELLIEVKLCKRSGSYRTGCLQMTNEGVRGLESGSSPRKLSPSGFNSFFSCHLV